MRKCEYCAIEIEEGVPLFDGIDWEGAICCDEVCRNFELSSDSKHYMSLLVEQIQYLESENYNLRYSTRGFVSQIRKLCTDALTDIEIIQDYPAKCGTLIGYFKVAETFTDHFKNKLEGK